MIATVESSDMDVVVELGVPLRELDQDELLVALRQETARGVERTEHLRVLWAPREEEAG